MTPVDETARRCLAKLRARGVLTGLAPPWRPAGAVRIGEHVSRRRFYRLFPPDPGAEPETLVLVVYESSDLATLERHVRATRWLQTAGVSVPAVFGVGDRGLLVEDAGDRLLAEVSDDAGRQRAYEAAVEMLLRLQRHGSEVPPPNPGMALDRRRLMQELEFFERHVLRGWLDVEDGGARRQAYDRLATQVARLPAAICHRDFHGRNLLIGERGELVVVDFQDLMPGPFLYDLASLVWDDYCDVPGGVRASACQEFWTDCGVGVDRLPEGADPVPDSPPGLPGPARRALAQVAVQRHLKALGTFGYQVVRGGRPEYARFAARTWRHARRALEALEMKELLADLSSLERLPDVTG